MLFNKKYVLFGNGNWAGNLATQKRVPSETRKYYYP
jgi:hypothetical protein